MPLTEEGGRGAGVQPGLEEDRGCCEVCKRCRGRQQSTAKPSLTVPGQAGSSPQYGTEVTFPASPTELPGRTQPRRIEGRPRPRAKHPHPSPCRALTPHSPASVFRKFASATLCESCVTRRIASSICARFT